MKTWTFLSVPSGPVSSSIKHLLHYVPLPRDACHTGRRATRESRLGSSNDQEKHHPGEFGGIISRRLCALAGDSLAAAAGEVFLCFTACFFSSAPARDTSYYLFLEIVS